MNKRNFSEQEEIEFQCNLETMLENEQEERERDTIRAKYDKVEYDIPDEKEFTQQKEIEYQCVLETKLENEQDE